MADKQALNATFFAFQKRDGAVLLPASIAFVIAAIVGLLIIGVAAFFPLGGMDFVHWYTDTMNAAAKGAPPSTPPNMGAIFMIFPIEMIALFFYFLLLASFESSCLRWMIRGERSGPFNLCLGADMWRVYGTYWFWFLYFFCTGILFFIVMFVLGLIGGVAGGKENAAVAGLIVLVGCIGWIVGWVYVAVRLAPAAAASIGAGHFAPLKSWSVSSDRFWALLGAFLLLTIIYIVAVIVLGAIAMGPYYAALFGSLDWSAAKSDPQAFSAAYQEAAMHAMQKMFSNPLSIGLYVVGNIAGWVVAIAFYILCYGVNARAVRVALEDGKLAHEPPAA